jgi:hypothetical protein
MQLTSRDLQVLRHLALMRYLDRVQIQRLEFGGAATSNAKRRLTLLYHHGFVGRRLLRSDQPHVSPLSLYFIERHGERALRDASVDVSSTAAPSRRAEPEPYFLRHMLETNDVWIAALLSAQRNAFTLSWHDEVALRRVLTGVRLGRRGEAAYMLAPIPDGYAQLRTGGLDLSFAVELDRGTCEEKRARKKFAAYGRFHAAGGVDPGRHAASRSASLSAERLFTAGLRVLFIASGRDAGAERARERRLLRWCEDEAGGSLFWCTTLSKAREHDFFTSPIWDVAGHAGVRSLVDSSGPPPPPRITQPPRIL